MSGPPHHFLPGLANPQQGAMRNQFGAGGMSNQMGGGLPAQMANQLGNQLPVQMPNQMGAQMASPLISPMGSSLSNQMGAQIGGQMGAAMGAQMNNQMGAQMNTQMNTAMASNTQMMGQLNPQFAMNATNPMQQHQNTNPMQMQQTAMGGLQHHTLQQQQQPVMHAQNTTVTPIAPVQPQTQQTKEFNTASLCRIGQETVQDIVSRTQEVFQTLKAIQPPNGTPQGLNASNEKKIKVQEQLRTIRVLFKRLRLIYERCNENCQVQGMEYTHIESLIPYKDEIDPKHDEKKNSEAYRLACEESKEVMEQVVLKNKQLKEVIDHLRRMIWEINTMLTMRKS